MFKVAFAGEGCVGDRYPLSCRDLTTSGWSMSERFMTVLP